MKDEDKSKQQPKTTLSVGLNRSTAKTDEARRVPGPKGSVRHQHTAASGKDGQFRSKPTRETITKAPSRTTLLPDLSVDRSFESEQFAAKGSLQLTPTGLLANAEAKHILHRGQVGDTAFTISSSSAQASASLGPSGLSMGVGIQGPSVEISHPFSHCVGNDQLIIKPEWSVGLGLGFGGQLTRTTNKTNSKRAFIIGGKIGTGVQTGVRVNIELNEDAPSCQGQLSDGSSSVALAGTSNSGLSLSSSLSSSSDLPFFGHLPQTSSTESLPWKDPSFMGLTSDEMPNRAIPIFASSQHPISQPSVPETTAQGTTDLLNHQAPLTKEQQQSAIQQHLMTAGLSEEEADTALQDMLTTDEHVSVDERLTEIYKHTDAAIGWLRQAEQREAHEANMQGIVQGLDFLDRLSTVTGCKPLQTGICVVKACITGYDAISKLLPVLELLRLGKSVAAGAVLGPIGMLGGAVLGLLGHFLGGGPDPTEIILRQIQGLSNQIQALGERMDANFRASFENQVRIMQAIGQGFTRLSEQLSHEIGAQRVALTQAMAHIQQTIEFFGRYQQGAVHQVFLTGLDDTCASAQLWILGEGAGNPRDNVPKVSNKLFHWINTQSANALVNGLVFWESWHGAGGENGTIASFINFHRELTLEQTHKTLNSFMGFAAAYITRERQRYVAKAEIADADAFVVEPSHMCNPVLWCRALENYVALKPAYPSFDNDPSNRQVDAAIAKGKYMLAFIKRLKNDRHAWDALFDDYYTALTEVETAVNQFADYRSHQLLKERNRIYAENEQAKVTKRFTSTGQEKITELNVLHDKPSKLFPQFNKRTINAMANVATRESYAYYRKKGVLRNIHTFAPFNPATLSKTPIYQGLLELLPNYILYAEFLGLIQLKAKQSSAIDGLIWRTQYPVPAVKNSLSAVETWMYGAKNVDATIALQHTMKTQSWRLPLTIAFNDVAAQSSHDLASLAWTGDWRYLPSVKKRLWRGDGKNQNNPNKTIIDGRHVAMYCLSAHSPTFFEHNVSAIENAWNASDNQACTLTHKQSDEALYRDHVTGLLDGFYFKERREIASLLLGQQTNDLSQAYIEAYKKSLLHLDKAVSLLIFFAKLSGKVTDENLFSALVTQTKIQTALTTYRNNAECDLDRPLIDVMTHALTAPKLTFDDVVECQQLADAEVDANHPQQLVTLGVRRLQSYKAWKQLYAMEFPGFNDVSLLEYEVRCAVSKQELAQDETYEYLRELNSERFNEAKFTLANHLRYFTKMSAKTYTGVYTEVCRWATQKARSDVVTGKITRVNADLTHIRNRQWVLTALPRGWDHNLRYLMLLAQSLGGCEFGKIQPINLGMWTDGFSTFLRVIYDSHLKKAAESAGNTTELRLNSLKDMLICGKEAKRIIYTIGLSWTLFKTIFDAYEENIKKLHEYSKNQYRGSKDWVVVHRHLSIKDAHHTVLIESICVFGNILFAYIQMVFGSHYEKIDHFNLFDIFRTKEQLLDALKEKEEGDYAKLSLSMRFDEHKGSMAVLRNNIVDEIGRAHELYQFWQFLQSYFVNRWPTNTLEISKVNMGAFFDPILTSEKLAMIDDFLHLNPCINQVIFSDIMIKVDMLRLILINMKKLPHVVLLAFRNTHLNDNVLLEAMESDMYLPNIQFFDLSGNDIKDEPSVCQSIQKGMPHLGIMSLHDYHINAPILDEQAFQCRYGHEPPVYNLPLNLPFGPAELTYFLQLGTKAQTALEKRLYLEKQGYDLSAPIQTADPDEIAALQCLNRKEQVVRHALTRLETSSVQSLPGHTPKLFQPSTQRSAHPTSSSSHSPMQTPVSR